MFRHAVREGLLPVVTYSGPLLADLLVGSFVVENLFQIRRIGVFLVNGSINQDYTMVVGLVILQASVLLLTLNLLVDVVYADARQARELWLTQPLSSDPPLGQAVELGESPNRRAWLRFSRQPLRRWWPPFF